MLHHIRCIVFTLDIVYNFYTILSVIGDLMNKQTTCCFTGHRPHKAPLLGTPSDPRYQALENHICLEILTKAMVYHCDTFLCGMAQGTDMLCGALVLRLRRMFRLDMRLVCVVPFLAQAKEWEPSAQERYKALLAAADEKILLSRDYTAACLLRRNEWMVAHSSHMIAVYDPRLRGGTAHTVSLARRAGLDVRGIDPNSF